MHWSITAVTNKSIVDICWELLGNFWHVEIQAMTLRSNWRKMSDMRLMMRCLQTADLIYQNPSIDYVRLGQGLRRDEVGEGIADQLQELVEKYDWSPGGRSGVQLCA
jgi:hypothetical protein